MTPYTVTKARVVSLRSLHVICYIKKRNIDMTIEIFVSFESFGQRLREFLWRCLGSEKEIYFVDSWDIRKACRRRKFECRTIHR